MLTKEECVESLGYIWNLAIDEVDRKRIPYNDLRKSVEKLQELIKEHFDNPPLKLSDIPYEEELICWGSVEKDWCSIYSEGGEISIAYFQLPTVYTMYETFDKKYSNRFYRKEYRNDTKRNKRKD